MLSYTFHSRARCRLRDRPISQAGLFGQAAEPGGIINLPDVRSAQLRPDVVLKTAHFAKRYYRFLVNPEELWAIWYTSVRFLSWGAERGMGRF